MHYFKLIYRKPFLFFFTIKKSLIFNTLFDSIKYMANNNIADFEIWEVNNEKKIFIDSSERFN